MTQSLTALHICVGLFLVLETSNVLALYFAPGSQRFNAAGVFAGWETSADNPNEHALLRYLVYWVAGTKVIFIALWLVILLTAGARTQVIASAVMVPAIATFYWRMYPIARQLDRAGLVRPTGYSKMLGVMIGVFIAVFAVVTAWSW